jgi:hypothetical protein
VHHFLEVLVDPKDNCLRLLLLTQCIAVCTVLLQYLKFYPVKESNDSVWFYMGLMTFDPLPEIRIITPKPIVLHQSKLPTGDSLINAIVPIVVRFNQKRKHYDEYQENDVYAQEIAGRKLALWYHVYDVIYMERNRGIQYIIKSN